MSNYILNIRTRTIHDGKNPCAAAQRMAIANTKYFEKYEDAVNFFEGKTKKGQPCSKCLKSYE